MGLPLPSRAEGERFEVAPGEGEAVVPAAAAAAAAAEAQAAASQGTGTTTAPKFIFEVEEVRKGDGTAPPKKGDLVVVEFVAKYASDGEVFDSTRARKKPIAFVFGGRPFYRGDAGFHDGARGDDSRAGAYTRSLQSST